MRRRQYAEGCGRQGYESVAREELRRVREYAKKGGFKSYEIISETIDPEGSKAVVKVKMEYGNGETEEEDYPMLKDEQGNWMLDAGK